MGECTDTKLPERLENILEVPVSNTLNTNASTSTEIAVNIRSYTRQYVF